MLPTLLALAFQQAAATDEVAFRTIGFGSNRQIRDGGAVVMRSAKSLDAYRRRMGMTSVKEPVVKWGSEQVVAIHAAGFGYGLSSIQVLKVRRKADGLEVEAAIDQGNRPPTPTPGVTPVLRKEGIYALIVVPPSKGEVKLRVVDQPASSGDKSGTPGLR